MLTAATLNKALEHYKHNGGYVEILDSTLRDGQQQNQIKNLSAEEKETLGQFILKSGVDAIEVTSTKVGSATEHEATKNLVTWAKQHGYGQKIEVLCMLDTAHVDDAVAMHVPTINLLLTGFSLQCTEQYRMNTAEHLAEAERVIAYARKQGLHVNVYLENWSSDLLRSDGTHQAQMIAGLATRKLADRIMLPDTMGILDPFTTYAAISKLVEEYPDTAFDFHGHNDHEQAVANSLAAARAGARRLHATVNGYGERTGNTKLEVLVASLEEQLHYHTNMDLQQIGNLSENAALITGVRVHAKHPLIGKDSHRHTAGQHGNGMSRNKAIYIGLVDGKKYGLKQDWTFGTGRLGGSANVSEIAQSYGFPIDRQTSKEVAATLKEQAEHGYVDKHDVFTAILKRQQQYPGITVANWHITDDSATGSNVHLTLREDGKAYVVNGVSKKGQFAAIVDGLRRHYAKFGKKFRRLVEYNSEVPPGEVNARSPMRVTTSWKGGKHYYHTESTDPDTIVAGLQAVMKMVNEWAYETAKP